MKAYDSFLCCPEDKPIPPRRLVRAVPGDAAAPLVAPCGAGELPFGVSVGPLGGQIVVETGAGVLVECGADIARGELAMSDDTGRAVRAGRYMSADPGALPDRGPAFHFGQALEMATGPGEVCRFWWSPGMIP